MKTIHDAIYSLDKNADFDMLINGTIVWRSNEITTDKIDTEIARLNSIEPMRLLRQERDRLLLSTDWAGNSDVTMPQNIATYRQALRDLPQDIAAGKIVAPTIDNNGNLVFNFPTI